MVDDSFYVMFNAHHEPVEFVLPEEKWGDRWELILNTAEAGDHLAGENGGGEVQAREKVSVQPWTLVLLRRLPSLSA